MSKVKGVFTCGPWGISDCRCGSPGCDAVYNEESFKQLKGVCHSCGGHIHYQADDGSECRQLLVKRARDIVQGNIVYFSSCELTDIYEVFSAKHGNWSNGKVKLYIKNYGCYTFKTGSEYVVCLAG